jgi:O-antigen ligase
MGGLVIAFKVLVAVVLLASAPLALKRRWRLFLAIPLCVLQGFIPGMAVAGVPIPLAFWGGLMLWPELVREIRNVVTWKPSACVLGIVLLYAVSLLWSPDPKLGLQPIGYFLQFLVVFAAAVTEGRRDESHIIRLLVVTVAMALIEATLVVVGRISPGMKLSFLLSPVAPWVVSPNIIDNLFTGSYNAVLDPTKSGGVFVNANVASAFLGISACTALGLSLHLRRRWLGAAGVILLAAVAFTGSKAGLMLAAAVPLLMLHLVSLRYRGWRNRLRMVMVAIMVAGIIGWLGPKAIRVGESGGYRALSGFFQRSDVTLSVREEIWQYGAQAFLRHPMKGQGFGGWQEDFPKYARKVGIALDLPPHNTVIYLWSQGGMLAALLGLAFIYQVLRIGWRETRERNASAFGLSLAMTGAFLWTFVHGMGTNFGLLGEIHMSPLLAGLLAVGYLHRRPSVAAARDGFLIPQRGYREEASSAYALSAANPPA